jgi:hypothetical protein
MFSMPENPIALQLVEKNQSYKEMMADIGHKAFFLIRQCCAADRLLARRITKVLCNRKVDRRKMKRKPAGLCRWSDKAASGTKLEII